jgi:hypothetical protein
MPAGFSVTASVEAGPQTRGSMPLGNTVPAGQALGADARADVLALSAGAVTEMVSVTVTAAVADSVGVGFTSEGVTDGVTLASGADADENVAVCSCVQPARTRAAHSAATIAPTRWAHLGPRHRKSILTVSSPTPSRSSRTPL